MTESLEAWIDRERQTAAAGMLRSVSARGIVRHRPGFGQTVTPVAGSIVASPVLGAYDPDPDYFFHWFRDSAIVIDALRLLHEAGEIGPEALGHLADFVRFSLSLQSLDGRALAASPSWRRQARPDFVRFLREEDLARAHGDAIDAETRVNPDGSLDLSRWPRPQHDGAPLRALALLRWMPALRAGGDAGAALRPALERLLRHDLGLAATHWRDDSYDIWEEELGRHYYTLRVAAGAMRSAAAWRAAEGDAAESAAWRAEAAPIVAALDDFWMPDAGHFRSRFVPDGAPNKRLDISTILGAIHTHDDGQTHTVLDPRQQATLDALERLFARLYPINARRARPAMGRYEGDRYYSGGAYYFSSLGAAEFCFRAAAAQAPGSAPRGRWLARGEGFLDTVRVYTPENGELSEQFDQSTGEQTSAKHLAWSYAAFISCTSARRAALPR